MTPSRSKWLYDFSCFEKNSLARIKKPLNWKIHDPDFIQTFLQQYHSKAFMVSEWAVVMTSLLCFLLFPAHLSSVLFSTVVFLLRICGQRLRLLSPKLNGQYWFVKASGREDNEVNVGTLSSWNYQDLIVPGLSRKSQKHMQVSR